MFYRACRQRNLKKSLLNRTTDYLQRHVPGLAALRGLQWRMQWRAKWHAALRKLLAAFTVCVCLLITPSAFPAGEKILDPDPGFSDCSIGAGAGKLVAQCMTLAVPLDPEAPDAEQLELSIARIPARRQSASTDALTLLAGGPGQSALESFPAVAVAFRHIMRDHDVILIDQRGTGNSARLSCPEVPDSLGTEFEVDTDRVSELGR